MAAPMKKVLVLCTGNSCRSQMAHGYLQKYADTCAEIFSAGVEQHGLNPEAVEIMGEDGLDISGHTSNRVEEYKDVQFDFIITVCDHAHEHCPVFPAAIPQVHHNFPDPSRFQGSAEDRKAEFRRVRNLIRAFCFEWVEQHIKMPSGT
jgi:arsenate reductase